MIPLEAGLLLWPALYDAYAPKIFVTYGVDPGEPPLLNERTLRTVLAVLVQGVVVGWWFLVLYRSAQQYAGPPDGPGWERRRPTCLKCGYIISLLPLAGKCPECGHPVRDSLAALTKASQFSHRKAYRAAVRAALASLRRRGE